MENNNELVEILTDITKRITKLEDVVYIENIKNSFKQILDNYLLIYLNEQNIVNFIDRDTQAVYKKYIEERRKHGYSDNTLSHIRSFNKAVRLRFPNLYIKHITRNGFNMYIWKVYE